MNKSFNFREICIINYTLSANLYSNHSFLVKQCFFHEKYLFKSAVPGTAVNVMTGEKLRLHPVELHLQSPFLLHSDQPFHLLPVFEKYHRGDAHDTELL